SCSRRRLRRGAGRIRSGRSCSREPPAHEIEEERGAGDGGHGADGELVGRNDDAAERIGEAYSDGAAKGDGWKEDAMIGTKNETHDVGNEKSDVADGAA